MKIEELEVSAYDNTYLSIVDTTEENLTENLSLSNIISKIKIKDYDHFLRVLSEATQDNNEHVIVLEDGKSRYVIDGNFAVRI